jgi:hypothetical protein
MAVSAVITADIVNFSLAPVSVQKKWVVQLGSLLQEQKFEFYRGDSFQVLLKDPQAALGISLQVRALARQHSLQHDIRTSIGIGTVNVPVRTLATASGEAFVLSGRTFDRLEGEDRMAIQTSDYTANMALGPIAQFADFLAKRWTKKQAEVMARLLVGESQEHIGKKLRKAQSTVNKHAQAGGWAELRRLLEAYKQVIIHFKLL